MGRTARFVKLGAGDLKPIEMTETRAPGIAGNQPIGLLPSPSLRDHRPRHSNTLYKIYDWCWTQPMSRLSPPHINTPEEDMAV